MTELTMKIARSDYFAMKQEIADLREKNEVLKNEIEALKKQKTTVSAKETVANKKGA